MLRKGVAVLAVSLVLAGCSSPGPSNGQIYGTAGGAALGGGVGRVIGHYALNATLVGAAAGAVVGLAAGTYMDPPAQEKQANATITAAENGQPVAWSTEKGNKGVVAATGAQFADRAGRQCRPLKQDVIMNGEQSARDVTACKASDGTWIVTEYQPEKAD